MNEGLDLAIIGGGLTVIQEIFVPKDSPIKTVADLRGKRLGVWSTGAGAFKAARAAIIDATGWSRTPRSCNWRRRRCSSCWKRATSTP